MAFCGLWHVPSLQMERKRIQNKIAESRWTLSTLTMLALAVWGLAGMGEHRLWINLLCLVLSTYLMVELNNANTLIRIYSRMVSGSFLVLATVCMHQLTSYTSSISILCMAGFYTSLFRSYQDEASPGWVFYAFICWGFASIVWPQALFFVPVFWLLMGVLLRAWSARHFCASLLGLLLPYAVVTAVLAVRGDLERMVSHFAQLGQFSPVFEFTALSIGQIVTLTFVTLCALIGSIHFLRKSHNDNIRTRQFYFFFLIIDGLTFAYLCVQPSQYEALLGILIVNTSPVIGHLWALTRTKWTNGLFLVATTLAVLLVAYNLMRSFIH